MESVEHQLKLSRIARADIGKHLEALQPSMATIPNARLFCLSSPYAQAGVLWEAFDQHYGKDHPASWFGRRRRAG